MTKTSSRQRVCIIIPAYNEAKSIADVLKDIKNEFKNSNFDFDVLVVNDGSHDNTSYTALENGAIVIDHILNIGVGGATATGLSYAQHNGFDMAITIDADGQHCAKDASIGVDKMMNSNTDLLIGSRLINKKGMSKVKILGNKGLTLITHILFGINVTDSQSGLRVFSRRALEQLQWETSGYEFCSEMLWRAGQIKLNIDEYPIKAIYTDYSISKGQNNWNAINIVKSLVKRRITELFE